MAKLNEVISMMEVATRPSEPQAVRRMTEADAVKLILGDLKDVPHMTAARTLGLSYGQVYAARNGYTFRHIFEQKHSVAK